MTARFALVLVTLLATAGTSRADDLIWHSSYQNPWSSWDAYRYKSVEDQSRERIDQGKQAKQAKVKHRPLKATDFKRAKGSSVLDEYIAATGLTGDEADNLRATLAAVVDTIESQVRKNNVATSMGILYAAAQMVVNGTELDGAATDQLIANLNDNLAADPAFKKLKAADKQRLNDTLLLQAAFIVVYAGQEDAASQELAQSTARAALQFLTGAD